MGGGGKQNHKERGSSHKGRFEVSERVFLDAMKSLVVQQLQQMSDIAAIQDQVVEIIQMHDQRTEWYQSQGLKHLFSPHFFALRKETKTFLCLLVFLVLELLVQLFFSGYFRHLMPHLPDFLQNLLK